MLGILGYFAPLVFVAILICVWRVIESWRRSKAVFKQTEFRQAEPHNPEKPKIPGEARVTIAKFTGATPMRRPVRRYTRDEDGSDPMRDRAS